MQNVSKVLRLVFSRGSFIYYLWGAGTAGLFIGGNIMKPGLGWILAAAPLIFLGYLMGTE